ncbi:MAG TPA: DUF3592 domain-containing protein [Aggregatilineales bacterium]|nr:DUF3592 domain-containing protein [Anaerolineales bacterium]HRE49417.1 DUF3592 domain-containing protein [Aggregatilineales bacterium]
MGSFFTSFRTISAVGIAAVLCVVALLLAIRALRGWRLAGISRGWNTTQGTVLAAAVQRSRRVGRTGGGAFYPVVAYEYNVGGKRYVGQRIDAGSPVGIGNYQAVERRVAAYPIGGKVTVYYDPNDPATAVLEHSAGASSTILVVAVVLVIIAISVLITFGGLRLG